MSEAEKSVRTKWPTAEVALWSRTAKGETWYVAVPPSFSPLFHVGSGIGKEGAWQEAAKLLNVRLFSDVLRDANNLNFLKAGPCQLKERGK